MTRSVTLGGLGQPEMGGSFEQLDFVRQTPPRNLPYFIGEETSFLMFTTPWGADTPTHQYLEH